jgi:predicted ATPase/class 3 adenylate cyclase
MPDLPSGTVTFLFTDIEGSTALWERNRTVMRLAVERHLALLRTAVEANGGVLYKTVGDGSQSAFPTAAAALTASLAAQCALHSEPWSDPTGPLQVRMALHVGEASPQDGDYLAAPLNRLARLLAVGHGRQVLLSQAVQQLVRDDLPAGASLRDLGEYRLRDLHHVEHVFQLVHPDLPDAFTDLLALDRAVLRVPAVLTSFLGREAEVSEIVARLRFPTVRLLTLTGPGGVGKTRIALEVGKRVTGAFADGVVFVDLAPLTDPQLVLPAIASVLGVRDSGGQSLERAVQRFLQEREILLILDNFEHLLEAAPVVTRLLIETSGPKVVATSRTSLRVRGEQEFPIASMRIPAVTNTTTVTSIAATEAVTLFVERAKEVRPDFVLAPDNVQAVAEICRRLDGLPLALELAAARIKLLPPDALLVRLEKRLALLTGGARDLPARQQTLHNTIAWSYDLLSPEEQTLFRRLSLFVGGWTLDTAEAVVNKDGTLDLLEGLTSLANKSLVRQVESAADESRFSMLETVREFAQDRLAEMLNEQTAMRDVHAAFFADLTIGAERQLASGIQDAIALVAAEQDNLRAALSWLLATGNAETTCRMAASLSEYWTFTGWQFAEGRAWLERALAGSSETSKGARAAALYGLASIVQQQGDYGVARAAAEESIALSQDGSDLLGMVKATYLISLAERNEGVPDAALARAEEGVRLARLAGDRLWLAWSLERLGSEMRDRGDLAGARMHLEEALETFRELGGQWGWATTADGLAGVAMAQRAIGRAAQLYAESLRVRSASGAVAGMVDVLAAVAAVGEATGQLEPAVRLLGACIGFEKQLGMVPFVLIREATNQTRDALRKCLGEVRFMAAWNAGGTLTMEQAITEALAVAEAAAESYA